MVEKPHAIEITPEVIEAGMRVFREWETATNVDGNSEALTPQVRLLVVRLCQLSFAAHLRP